MALIDEVHKMLNERYAARKAHKQGGYAPEPSPAVKSDQVLALMEVLVERIELLAERLDDKVGELCRRDD